MVVSQPARRAGGSRRWKTFIEFACTLIFAALVGLMDGCSDLQVTNVLQLSSLTRAWPSSEKCVSVLQQCGRPDSGSYTVQLPSGTFNVQIFQTMSSVFPVFSSSSLTTNLGAFAAANPLNFTAPTITTATLSGTVSITGSSSLPANSFLTGTDVSGGTTPQTISSGFESPPSTGAYSFTFGTGRTCALNLTVSVQLLPSPAPPGSYTPPAGHVEPSHYEYNVQPHFSGASRACDRGYDFGPRHNHRHEHTSSQSHRFRVWEPNHRRSEYVLLADRDDGCEWQLQPGRASRDELHIVGKRAVLHVG